MRSLSLICLLFPLALFSQTDCLTDAYLLNYLNEHPEKQADFEKLLVEFPDSAQKSGDAVVITIPVVFHVVYYDQNQNVSETQLQEAIQVLNADYRRQNADAINTYPYQNEPYPYTSIPADCEIEFCLRQVIRVPSPYAEYPVNPQANNGFGDVEYVKQVSPPVNPDYNLNVWVCNIQNFAGYASFPGGALPQHDGITVDYQYIGYSGTAFPNYAGRTITHETGHWLGLFHIWGNAAAPPFYDNWGNQIGYYCADDYVADTWPQHRANPNGCSYDFTNCPNYVGFNFAPNLYHGMNENYMDYSTGGCLNFFSTGQKTRMRNALNQFRPFLAANVSNNCNLDAENFVPDQFTTYLLNSTLHIQLTQALTGRYMVLVYDMSGRRVLETPVEISGTEIQVPLQNLQRGMYLVQIPQVGVGKFHSGM